MATLKPRRGKWYARIQKWDGIKQRCKDIPLKTESKVEARIRFSQVEKVEKDIKKGEEFSFPWLNGGGSTKVKPKSLIDTIESFIEYRTKSENLRPATIESNRRVLNLFLSVIGDIPVQTISLSHLDRFTKHSQSLEHSKHTINIGLRTIRTYLIWLYDREIIEKTLKIKELKTDKSQPKYISEVEYEELMTLDFGEERFKRMFKLHWETGLRLSESFSGVINGNWLDIPAERAKNHNSRSIEINDEQKKTIKLIQKVWKENGSTKDHIKWYSKKLKKGLLKIGILDKHFHCLRHSFGARRIIETNGNIHLVRDEMGHSTVNVTERYTKLDRKRVLEDFPSLKNELKTPIFAIKDTKTKDTNRLGKSVYRGGFA